VNIPALMPLIYCGCAISGIRSDVELTNTYIRTHAPSVMWSNTGRDIICWASVCCALATHIAASYGLNTAARHVLMQDTRQYLFRLSPQAGHDARQLRWVPIVRV